MHVAVYTIARNEYDNIEAWLSSCADADSITFCDTGSTDGTPHRLTCIAIAKQPINARVEQHTISIDPWRFDDAHNAASALVPASADICIPLHLDERLRPGWRGIIEAHWRPGITTKGLYTYVFNHKPDGSPDLQFTQDRIHARKGYRWKYPDHEGCYPDPRITEIKVMLPGLVIEQWQDRSKDRSGIMARLEVGIKEYPNDARMMHYYGRELMYAGRWTEALTQFQNYLRTPQQPFALEHAQTAEYMAKCWRMLDATAALNRLQPQT